MTNVTTFLAGSAALAAETKVPLSWQGQTIDCRPPTRAEAAQWLQLLGRCYGGDLAAIAEANHCFPGFVGQPPEAFEGLLPMELVVLATRFFLTTREAVIGPTLPPVKPAEAS